MRHRKFSQRLSRPTGARLACLRNLAIALLKYQRIKTTRAKARFAQSLLERLVSLGKQGSLHSRRHALKLLADKSTVNRLFSQIAPLFKNRPSGFTRIINLSNSRGGDGAKMVLWELTEKTPKVKPKPAKKGKTTKEPAPSQEAKKPKAEAVPEERAKFPKKPKTAKQIKPKKFLGGLRRLFKKERDAL